MSGESEEKWKRDAGETIRRQDEYRRAVRDTGFYSPSAERTHQAYREAYRKSQGHDLPNGRFR